MRDKNSRKGKLHTKASHLLPTIETRLPLCGHRQCNKHSYIKGQLAIISFVNEDIAQVTF